MNRTARAPVVGWPPVRSFRKNLGSNNSSKSDDQMKKLPPKDEGIKTENNNIGLINNKIKSDNHQADHMFVKVNMEGVPIGRKVDLKSYDSYQKLSYAIDQLFRGLLAGNISFKLTIIIIKFLKNITFSIHILKNNNIKK